VAFTNELTLRVGVVVEHNCHLLPCGSPASVSARRRVGVRSSATSLMICARRRLNEGGSGSAVCVQRSGTPLQGARRLLLTAGDEPVTAWSTFLSRHLSSPCSSSTPWLSKAASRRSPRETIFGPPASLHDCSAAGGALALRSSLVAKCERPRCIAFGEAESGAPNRS
jgi:hypothetical protein